MNRTVLTVRWIARALSILVLLFWGYFVAGHLFGSAAQPSHPLTINDSLQFSMVVLWLVGLAVAWRWELVGAAIALVAALIGGLLNQKALAFGLAPAVPAVLFLCSWWMRRAARFKNSGA